MSTSGLWVGWGHLGFLSTPVIALIGSLDKGFRGLDLIAPPFRW
ncbi:MAG TPA: hypothetical protein VIL94_05940 [Acidothermaceae bacterium]